MKKVLLQAEQAVKTAQIALEKSNTAMKIAKDCLKQTGYLENN